MKIVVSSLRLPLWAVIVIEPASAPVTVFVAMSLEAVALPRPVTVPAPLVLLKLTDVDKKDLVAFLKAL